MATVYATMKYAQCRSKGVGEEYSVYTFDQQHCAVS